MIGRTQKFSLILAAASIVTAAAEFSCLRAADVLLNGGFENGAGPEGWTLIQTTAPTTPPGDFNNNGIVDAADYVVWRKTNGPAGDYTLFRSNYGSTSGGPGTFVAATEQLDSAQEGFPTTTGLGLLVKPYAGNVGAYLDQNKPVDVTLTQTFNYGSFAAGRTYTLAGSSLFQAAYSGNIDTLFADSPSGAVPSPTQTKFQLEFLNASNSVLATQSLDLPKHRMDEPPVWQQHSLMGTAPAGTTKIRVSAIATNMVASCTTACPNGQDVYLDNFSLKDSVTPALERLVNGNLNTPGAPTNWTLVAVGNDVAQFNHDSFAIHTGQTGFWLRSFQGNNPGAGNPGPVDAKVLQTIAGTPGTSYTFSAWAKLQPGYSGLDPSSGTQTFITMEFLNSGGSTIGSPVSLELGVNGPLGQNFWPAGDDNQGVWQQVSLPPTVAPAGTANIRVSSGASGMIKETVSVPQSAMFDDLSLLVPGSGSGNLLSGALAAMIPEPSACCLVLVAIGCGFGLRHKRAGR